MNSETIEKIDRQRYKSLIWQTAAFAIFWLFFILRPMIENNEILNILTFLVFGFFVVVSFKQRKLEFSIKKDKVLNEALNNEMHKSFEYKSVIWAFYMSMGILALMLFLKNPVSPRILCMGIIYIGIMTRNIAQLIYNR